jgi:hypothetical protein
MELHDLFAESVDLKLPAEDLFEGRVSSNPINHLRRGAGRLKTKGFDTSRACGRHGGYGFLI